MDSWGLQYPLKGYFQPNIISLWGWHFVGKAAGVLAQIKGVL